APRFAFSDADRSALATFLTFSESHRDTSLRADVEAARHLFDHLRCSACHARDHASSPRASIIVEETETGLLPESLPSLTWAGEKLHASWTRALLAGETARARPWLKARMPAFPAY